MKRGEVYLAEIKEYRSEGLMVKVVEKELLLPAGEIKDGIKQKHKKMVGWYIPVRVQSLRPFAVSNMRIDKTKLRALGLRDAKPIEKPIVATTKSQPTQTNEPVTIEKKENIKEESKSKKMVLTCEPLLNGIMAYWEKVEEAASYTVSLYINDQVISTRINDRKGIWL